MIFLTQSVVSLGEAMYQSAFLSLEFRPNLEFVTSVAKHKFKKIRQKFRFDSLSNFSPAIRRENKVFWFPGFLFSTTLPLFKRELPENAWFRCQFRPLRAQNTKKIPKKNYKNLNDLKLIFLELVHLGLCSGKVWENRFFLDCMTLVDPYSKLLLNPTLCLERYNKFQSLLSQKTFRNPT